MTTSNTILLPSISSPTRINVYSTRGIPMKPFDESIYQQNAIIATLNQKGHSDRPQLLSHHIDPILLFHQQDTSDSSGRNLLPEPLPSNHNRLHPQDSRKGINRNDSSDAGRTVSKIPFNDFCGPLLSLVHVLRDSRNLSTDHKIANSHNTNCKELTNQNSMISTMTYRPLLTDHVQSHRIDITNSPKRNCPPSRGSRIRSRSIAIKRPTNEQRMEEIRQNSLAAEYDWATWRMYNRIIEHRQKNPLQFTHEESLNSLDAASTASSKDDTDCRISYNENHSELQHDEQQQQYYPEYGEVFDLDL